MKKYFKIFLKGFAILIVLLAVGYVGLLYWLYQDSKSGINSVEKIQSEISKSTNADLAKAVVTPPVESSQVSVTPKAVEPEPEEVPVALNFPSYDKSGYFVSCYANKVVLRILSMRFPNESEGYRTEIMSEGLKLFSPGADLKEFNTRKISIHAGAKLFLLTTDGRSIPIEVSKLSLQLENLSEPKDLDSGYLHLELKTDPAAPGLLSDLQKNGCSRGCVLSASPRKPIKDADVKEPLESATISRIQKSLPGKTFSKIEKGLSFCFQSSKGQLCSVATDLTKDDAGDSQNKFRVVLLTDAGVTDLGLLTATGPVELASDFDNDGMPEVIHSSGDQGTTVSKIYPKAEAWIAEPGR